MLSFAKEEVTKDGVGERLRVIVVRVFSPYLQISHKVVAARNSTFLERETEMTKEV